MNNKKRSFREHVKTSPGAACPRQVEIQDRRAFIASLGGVLLGGVMLGCSDDSNSGGASPDAGVPDLNHTSGLPDSNQSKLDLAQPDRYISPGIPKDLKAPIDQPVPDLNPDMDIGPAGLPVPDRALIDQHVPHDMSPDMDLNPAGLPPPPDASMDMYSGPAGVPPLPPDASSDKKP